LTKSIFNPEKLSSTLPPDLETVARFAAAKLGSQGRVVATDIAVLMLALPGAKPVVAGAARIEYVESPAAPLAAPPGAFDAVFKTRASLARLLACCVSKAYSFSQIGLNGRAAIAVWAQIERNQIFAAYHAALRATVPAELASLMMAPFSWPSGSALKDAAEEAGFRKIRLLTRRCRWCWKEAWTRQFGCSLPHRCRSVLPALPAGSTRGFLRTAAARVGPLESDGKVIGRNDFKYYHRQLPEPTTSPIRTTHLGIPQAEFVLQILSCGHLASRTLSTKMTTRE
jgi:hypothetical protein